MRLLIYFFTLLVVVASFSMKPPTPTYSPLKRVFDFITKSVSAVFSPIKPEEKEKLVDIPPYKESKSTR